MTASSPPPPPEQRNARQTSGEKTARRRAYREASERRAAEERATIDGADAKADQENRSGVAGAEGEPPYFTDADGYLCRYKQFRDAKIKIRLANFTARIVEENLIDDGAEQSLFYTIAGKIEGNGMSATADKHQSTLQKIEIPAAQFAGMSWPHRCGSRAILEPGRSIADSVRHAIQIASADAGRKTHFGHTGWRQINGSWAYLHAGGAVGAEHVSVRLPHEYQRFRLPALPENEAEAIQISLSFLDIGKHEITLPLLAYTFIAPMTTILSKMPNFSCYLFGVSGSFKTTVAALCLSHFGDFSSINELPNFNDTAGSIEKRAFRMKDALFLLDDYTPSHGRQQQQRKEDIAQAAIRAFANRTGRARLRSDASEMTRTYPRGMLLATGEESPSLQSTLARLLTIELSRTDIDKAKLTLLQGQAHRLPHAMTSYLLWIRDNMTVLTGAFERRFNELRSQATTDGNHGRLAEQTAFLMFALETWSNWMNEKGIFSEASAREYLAEGWTIFQDLSAEQQKRVAGDDPITSFFEILGTLVYQHRARLDPCHHEGAPVGAGDRIGFYDSSRLYLQFNAAWNAAMIFLSKEGGHFPFSKGSFVFMLKQRGSIVLARNGDTSKAKTIGGESVRIMEIQEGVLLNAVTSVISVEE